MFTDKVTLHLIAGKGGNGVIAWRREKYIPKGGPAGGDGGNGASITLQSTSDIYSLEDYRNIKIIRAENGQQGGSGQKKGRNGKEKVVKVPLGTLVKDPNTQEILFDFTEKNQSFKVCKGGIGGKGNCHFKSSTNQAPNIATNGTSGEEIEIELELKLIADIGLVGMPNAGKSTLISKLTKLPVKIAPYPFTTLKPNLGLIEFDDFSRILIADIPGIIYDAHKNKGLGLSFLRHIERTEVLMYVIDISKENPFEDFQILQKELTSYDPTLIERPSLIVLNKSDLLENKEVVNLFKKNYKGPCQILETSALQGDNLPLLTETLRELSQKNGKKF